MCAERSKVCLGMRERFVKGRNERHMTGSLGALAVGMHVQVPAFLLPFHQCRIAFCSKA